MPCAGADGTDGTIGGTIIGFLDIGTLGSSDGDVGGSLTFSPVLKITFLSTETLCLLG